MTTSVALNPCGLIEFAVNVRGVAAETGARGEPEQKPADTGHGIKKDPDTAAS